MADQKQCPKCGEKNPAEAVMCWACYTSLSGGAAAVGIGAGGPAAAPGKAPMTDSGEKKKIQPAHLAIIGVGLLVALGFGATQLLGSGGEAVDEFPLPPPKPQSSSVSSEPAQPQQAVISLPPGPSPAMPNAVVPAAGPVYNIVASPNPREQWATMAIAPVNGQFKEKEAQAVAQFASRQLQRSKKYAATEIVVINDTRAAEIFSEHYNRNQQKPLSASDYTDPTLVANVWPFTPVRYVNANGKESFTFPQKNPTGFWKNKPGSQ
jgi:hypothetical protein